MIWPWVMSVVPEAIFIGGHLGGITGRAFPSARHCTSPQSPVAIPQCDSERADVSPPCQFDVSMPQRWGGPDIALDVWATKEQEGLKNESLLRNLSLNSQVLKAVSGPLKAPSDL